MEPVEDHRPYGPYSDGDDSAPICLRGGSPEAETDTSRSPVPIIRPLLSEHTEDESMADMPDVKRNPIEDAMRDFRILQGELDAANRQIREMADINSRLLAEGDTARHHLTEALRKVSVYSRYCDRLNLRLERISSSIAEARKEAGDYALAVADQASPEDPPRQPATAQPNGRTTMEPNRMG